MGALALPLFPAVRSPGRRAGSDYKPRSQKKNLKKKDKNSSNTTPRRPSPPKIPSSSDGRVPRGTETRGGVASRRDGPAQPRAGMLRGAQVARPLQGGGSAGREAQPGWLRGYPRGCRPARGRNLRAAGWQDAEEEGGLAGVLGAGRGSRAAPRAAGSDFPPFHSFMKYF